jgi:hypothetical protein
MHSISLARHTVIAEFFMFSGLFGLQLKSYYSFAGEYFDSLLGYVQDGDMRDLKIWICL